jgi:hypothetical protein
MTSKTAATAETHRTAADAALEIAACEAAFVTCAPADAACLTGDDVRFLVAMIRYEVQSRRLAAYAR